MKQDLKFRRIGDHLLPLPKAETDKAAGIDLRSVEPLVIPAGRQVLAKTGFAVELPSGVVGLVCPRSGLALRRGITVLNAPGVIDEDYRGEVGVILHNINPEPAQIEDGERIAQLVLAFIHAAGWHPVEVDALGETARGEFGFGSTGTS